MITSLNNCSENVRNRSSLGSQFTPGEQSGPAMPPLDLTREEAGLPALVNNCVLIGHGSRADCIWSRNEFLTLCEHMMNGNPPSDFLHVYRDVTGVAKFSRGKTGRADRRASWAWETITGKAKSKVGIGFYPSNARGESRWGAMDFDAHDGDAFRARELALAAFHLLRRQPQLYVVLGTSGSDGWHLFVFTQDFHPVSDWTRLLRQVATFIGTEIRPGLCEIFPNDPAPRSLGHAIRAPGTWNPKHDTHGTIAFQSVTPLIRERERECPFLYHATDRERVAQLYDRAEEWSYRGTNGAWKEQFAITEPSSRHEQLKALVLNAFCQAGFGIVRWNAAAQFREASPAPRASIAEHLREFEEVWAWATKQWIVELSEAEAQAFQSLSTDTERDAFRITRGFARKAKMEMTADFPFPVENLAARLGITHQGASKLRVRFVQSRILAKTADHVTNKKAARFRWLLP